MEAVQKKKTLKRLIITIAVEFLLVTLVVWFFDPFYQYHAPFLGMEAVLNDRDNQMPGTIRNFAYDSVLVGSSVAENFDSSFLDETYDCSTLKVIRASGSLADLLYYLEMAQENRNLQNVFWCLDVFAMDSPVEVTLYGGDTPRYLHTETVLDDLPYLYNKEILLEKIPSTLAFAYQGINVGGEAYNWSRDKIFSSAQAMRAYDRSGIELLKIEEQKDFPEQKQLVADNIDLLICQIEAHPEITFRFLFPPYSMLWWDCAYINGELNECLYILEETLSALLAYENVEVYFFQNEEAIVCDLDNYMDMIHYSPDINQYMLDRMTLGKNKVTRENLQDTLKNMRELAMRITTEEIYRYYPKNL